jgi:serine phosphatase RsbU (regulator of sigma subunit)
MAIRFNNNGMVFAGKHQDLIVYRSSSNKTEIIPSKGTWLGIADDIGDFLEDSELSLDEGDIVLLFTDGITEANNQSGAMFGQERLKQALHLYADLPVGKLLDNIMRDVKAYSHEQMDDMTLLAIKKGVKNHKVGQKELWSQD